jgi:hypothetical protein
MELKCAVRIVAVVSRPALLSIGPMGCEPSGWKSQLCDVIDADR